MKSIDLYGNNLRQLAKEFGISLNLAEIKKSREEKGEGTFVIKIPCGKTLSVSTAYYNDEAKKLNGYVMLFHDITESQKLEEMRREFVANVSHELKTPITTIKAYAETLNSGMVDDEGTRQEFMNIIEKEADRMTTLVSDLLELSHIDFKKTQVSIQEVEILPLVEECLEHLKMYYEGKQQKILWEDRENPTALVDRNKMAQVIVNILSNASKYTAKEGRISLGVKAEDGQVYIRIRDNGIGIPAGEVDRVFERFYRVDKGRARDMGGTGLGLAIARDTVRVMGGDIFARSELGQGSEFIIRIPQKI